MAKLRRIAYRNSRNLLQGLGLGSVRRIQSRVAVEFGQLEAQMLFLASNGYRCIAHDRRGHGRSSQPWNGNEMNTYADDLATLMDTLNLKIYAGAPHGLAATHKDRLNADLLEFIKI